MNTQPCGDDRVQGLGAAPDECVEVACSTCGSVVRCSRCRVLVGRDERLEVLGTAGICGACGYAVLAVETVIAMQALFEQRPNHDNRQLQRAFISPARNPAGS